MKQFLFLFSLIFFALPLMTAAQKIDLQVKGVDIGASYQTALRQLGKPLSSKKGGTNPCGNTKLMLRYPGLTLTFDADENGQNFIVVKIEITSPNWEVAPQVKVGVSLKDVKAKFVQTDKPEGKSGLEKLSYFVTDGYANFYFRGKKLIKIAWELNLC